MAQHADLVAQVKALQRDSPELKHAWHRFCEEFGEGTRDPNRHTTQFLEGALHAMAHARPAGGTPGGKGFGGGKGGGGVRRATAPVPSVEAFFAGYAQPPQPPPPAAHPMVRAAFGLPPPEGLAAAAAAAGGAGGGKKGKRGKEGVRMRGRAASSPGQLVGSGAADGGGGGRTVAHEVKLRQRDPAWRGEWVEFCRSHAADPSDVWAHPPEFLHGALRAIDRRLGRGGGEADVSPAVRPLAARVKDLQRDCGWHTRWADYCHVYGDGTRDPSRHSPAFLRHALATLEQDHRTEEHARLVGEVKALQKTNALWNEHWQTYCERFSDGTRDPANHEAFFLSLAMEEVEKHVAHNREHSELVERVKTQQRDSPAWRTRWTDYCELYGDGTRDPAHHGAHFLRRALRDLGSDDPAQRVGMRASAANHQALVQEVKERQRADPRWQELWAEYCATRSDGTFDPAHHDPGFLRRALREVNTAPWKAEAAAAARVEEVQLICEARRKAQRSKAFDRADTLREVLWGMGVEVDDKRKTWRSDDGLAGCFLEPDEEPPIPRRRGTVPDTAAG